MEYDTLYRLGRGLYVNSDQLMYGITQSSSSKTGLTKNMLDRTNFFSRCKDYADFSVVERLFVANINTFVIACNKNVEKGKPMVYTYKNYTATALCPEEKNSCAADIATAIKQAAAVEQLQGKPLVNLSEDEMERGDYVDLTVEDGDIKYMTVNTDYFNRHFAYHTLHLDEDGGLTTQVLPDAYAFYRSTKTYRNGYPMIPKGSLFITVNKDSGEAALYDSAPRDFRQQELAKTKSLNDLLGMGEGDLRQRMLHAADEFNRVKLVNPETCAVYVSAVAAV